MRTHYSLVIGAACLALSACQTTQTPPPISNLALDGPASASLVPDAPDVDIAQGLALFNEICVRTLPDFQEAENRLEALGFNRRPETGTMVHSDLDLSFNLQGKVGFRRVCSLVFNSAQDEAALHERMRIAYLPPAPGLSEHMWAYKSGGDLHLMFVKSDANGADGHYHNLKLLSAPLDSSREGLIDA